MRVSRQSLRPKRSGEFVAAERTGAATARTLCEYGLDTVGKVAAAPLSTLQRLSGARGGRELHEKAQGIDLTSLLVNAQDEDTGATMTDVQARDQIMTFLMAGHETVSAGMSWVWYLLSTNPDCAARVVAEVDDVLGDRPPTVDDVPRLGYISRVIDESMRLYPPLFVLPRTPLEGEMIRGYHIPSGTTFIALCPYVTHRHKEFWDNPEGFDPDRFEPAKVKERHRFAYFPFGGGPRKCIGDQFGLVQMRVIVAMTVQRYRLDPLPWGGDTTQRVTANMGNAIFIAAYLIMSALIALGRVVTSFHAILTDEDNNRLPGNVIRAALYIFIFAVNLVAIYWSGSRGPWLGLLAGLAGFVEVAASVVVVWTAVSAQPATSRATTTSHLLIPNRRPVPPEWFREPRREDSGDSPVRFAAGRGASRTWSPTFTRTVPWSAAARSSGARSSQTHTQSASGPASRSRAPSLVVRRSKTPSGFAALGSAVVGSAWKATNPEAASWTTSTCATPSPNVRIGPPCAPTDSSFVRCRSASWVFVPTFTRTRSVPPALTAAALLPARNTWPTATGIISLVSLSIGSFASWYLNGWIFAFGSAIDPSGR